MEKEYTVEALIAGGVLTVKNPDFVRAILEENKLYTIKAANKKLAAFYSNKEAK